MFWIRGSPGSGKSTLLKYLYEHEETANLLGTRWSLNTAIAAFFFYDEASSTSQKSIDDLLSYVLRQLLLQVEEFFPIVEPIYDNIDELVGWKRRNLEKAFNAISQHEGIPGCLTVFVDALDEYAGRYVDVARRLKEFLAQFSHSDFKIKICASSRPLGEFETMLGDLPGFAMQDWTARDIRLLVNNRFLEAKRDDLSELSETIVTMASGVFIWVDMVLKELSAPLFDQWSESDLDYLLTELPQNLDSFYRLLIDRVPRQLRPYIGNVLQLLNCGAGRFPSLTLAEISLAASFPDDPCALPALQSLLPKDDLKRCQDMKRRLDTWLSGFVEIVRQDGYVPVPSEFEPLTVDEYHFTMSIVDFTHKTGKDFIKSLMDADFFEPTIPLDNLLLGHTRLCRLYTCLARIRSGV
jgi:hypothetical protein